jgi:hypothetical protein
LRKLAAILLVGLLLFNWVGYRVLHEYLQDRATRQLQAKLDKAEYQPDQLLHVKVPTTHLSYFNASDEFESIEGRIDIGGVPYQYVARRIANDSAEYLCIPNQRALSLRNSRDNYYSLVNALGNSPKDPKGAESHSLQSFFGDPFELPADYAVDEKVNTQVSHQSLYILRLPKGMSTPAEHPPDSKA